YIDLGLYHQVERSHPYYVEMIGEILALLGQRFHGRQARLLELGAGTGLATLELLALENLTIDALEIDEECLALLAEHTRSERARCIQGDAVTYCRNNPYDCVVSVFAHDHIHYDKAEIFARNIRNNLSRGGVYIMGGEILPRFTSEAERIDALKRYHGFIVNAAIAHGDYELAQIEINALKSGVFRVGDFKRHESQFEEEMLSADFQLLSKVKVGPDTPDDVGGVYVYVFQAV
ncbi:MAG: class I SAM-dependent methyltransferase, partial [Magnetococcales bacterium]|nr:class I SAM-dependent methyltransferase [Magnetococcales bacterium]